MNEIRIKEIFQADECTLKVVWTDHKDQSFDVRSLRKACPCALCVDEVTGEKKLDPSSIKSDTRPITIQSVGRYALNIHFSDGHRTGIYTFEKLRQMASENSQ